MNDIKYLGVQGLEELIAITKNNFAKKADTLQFDVMPDPANYTGKVVQYVGVSDESYTRSHFYYSDGTRWTGETISDEQTIKIKIVYALPDWISADPQVLYVLKGTENKLLSLYVKNTAVNDSWYTTESSGSFAIVDDLPEWYAADHNTIYFKAEGSDAALTGYIKNTGASDAWYTVGAQQEVDTFLSSTSTNPVQNKIVYAAIQDVLAQVANVYHFKGSCKAAALPSEGNVVGDTWNLEDASSYGPAGVNVAWTGTEWDALSGDMNYMRGLHDPNFSGSTAVTSGEKTLRPNETIVAFTCPKRGFVLMGLRMTDISGPHATLGSLSISVPGIDTDFLGKYVFSTFVPVNKGDVISITNDDSDNRAYFSYSIRFVPYQVQ